MIDSIVAGVGVWGCTLTRLLAEEGRKVLVLEKRTAVGGNCRCEIYPATGEKFSRRSITTTSNYNSLILGGRLGGYKYYDMNQAMAAALEVNLGSDI